jgi:hypothetical protein
MMFPFNKYSSIVLSFEVVRGDAIRAQPHMLLKHQDDEPSGNSFVRQKKIKALLSAPA